MRTDAKIDRKQVYCPNVVTLGYSRPMARFGYFVTFNEGRRTVLARVVGRIASAPRIDNDPDVRGYLVVMAIGFQYATPMERWINPKAVLDCFPPNTGHWDCLKFMQFFFGADFKKQSVETLRGFANYGSSDFNGYLNRAK